MPSVSVIMPVYNGAEFLPESIESVLNQTVADFELLIIEDCSTDNSLQIIEKYAAQDTRIRIIRKDKNKGLPGFIENLNIGISEAKGKYLARMDQDDICEPARFQMQTNFLETHPHIYLVGSSAEKIDKSGKKIGDFQAETNPEILRKRLAKYNELYHPTIMFRNDKKHFYREKMLNCEDYDFYLTLLSANKNLANIPDKVLKYRVLETSISRNQNSLIKYLFIAKAQQFYRERKNRGFDTYEHFSPENLLKIFDLNYGNSKEEMLIAAKTAIFLRDNLAFKKINLKYLHLFSERLPAKYQLFNKLNGIPHRVLEIFFRNTV